MDASWLVAREMVSFPGHVVCFARMRIHMVNWQVCNACSNNSSFVLGKKYRIFFVAELLLQRKTGAYCYVLNIPVRKEICYVYNHSYEIKFSIA